MTDPTLAPTRPIDVVRSLLFYFVFYLGTIPYVLATVPCVVISPEAFRLVVRAWSRFHRDCCRWILGIKVAVEGEFPEEGLIIAMRHESFFEAIDMGAQMHWPAPFPKAELGDIPGWGWALKRYGAVMVDREGGAKSLRRMIAVSRERVAEGRPLVIFPEGTRVPVGRREPLRAGFAGTYKLLGLPVVPVAVDSGRLYHRRWKKPGVITYRVGERIEAGLPRPEVEARVTEAISPPGT